MGRHELTLLFSDNETRSLSCSDYESVVQAAGRHGLNLLVDCREGGCGTCKAVCHSGHFSLDDYSREALTDAELASGRVLACRMQPQSPCVVEFDYPLEMVRRGTAAAPRAAKIIKITRRADVVLEVTIEAEDGKPFHFIPGQYSNLHVPGTNIVRSYSFVNQPGEARATFLLRLIEGGALSEWMRGQQEPGASLLVAGPFGRFFLRDAEQPLVFVAGGTGIGPTISMIEHMKARGVMPPSLKLVFGVNTLASLFYRERLAELIADFPNSELVVAVVKPEGTWDGVVGTAVDGLKAIALAPGSHIYLCGPPIMTEHAQNHLRSQGIAERAVFAEAFLPTLDAKAA